MSFHFISLLSEPKTYLTMVDNVGRPRFMTFTEEHLARTCIRYMARYKARNGHWPNMDLERRVNVRAREVGVKIRHPGSIANISNASWMKLRRSGRCFRMLRSG